MTRPRYPHAPRLDLVDDYHGTPVPDPYRWLEDSEDEEWRRWRADWARQQQALFTEHRDRWGVRDWFADHLKQLLAGGFTGLPAWRGDRQFFMRRQPGQQFPVLLTVDPDGTERVLIDPIELDPDGLTTLDGYRPSWDGGKLAFLISVGGAEESVLQVMDVATREVVDGPIDRTRFSSVAWLPGGEAFYYVRREDPATLPPGEAQFHRRVRLHRLGTDADADAEVFGAGQTITNYYSVAVTRDGRWLVVDASEGTAPRNDVYLADLTASPPEAPALVSVVEGRDANTSLTIRPDGRMYVWTDFEAPRGRLLAGDPASPTPEYWQPLLAEDPQSVLESFRLSDGPDGADQYLVTHRTAHTVASLQVVDSRTGALVRDVELPGPGTIGGPVGRPEGGSENWFAYTDHTSTPHVYRYDAVADETTLWASPPGSVTVPDVVTQQVAYRSADGTTVHMTVISRERTPSGARPTILYGYGGFGIPLPPAYNATALAWVQAGGVYAVANLRGGSEEGEEWHRAGMLANKQHVFDDFHAAAQWLVEHGWTTREQLCISGGSNGGLLVGAALTQHPESFGAVLCAAPLLDMVRYVTSQLGATWTVEYGDPKLPHEFSWLWSYSPYHHVRPGIAYPATLVMVFDNDTRTDPMHGRKMVAALQHATAGAAPILLRTEPDVGHSARALDTSIAETAESLGFAAHATGLTPPPPED